MNSLGITLTTDFGDCSPYVAAMKGVILSIHPAVRLFDLSHAIPPQDIRHAAHFLAAAIPYFPPGLIHVVVVDPGVGSDRALLYVEVAGHRLLVPDNGCWTRIPSGDQPPLVRRLTERRFWRPTVSATFHGRDILAPVAAHLSLGIDPALLGPVVDEWVRLPSPPLRQEPDRMVGEVAFIDHFGNLITNIPGEALPIGPLRISVAGRQLTGMVRTYADAPAGTLVALVSSQGTLEIAVVQGNAARTLGVRVGEMVEVSASSD
ncbi:MAG: SAM-dependent chlorinase/fluorinase [Gemmataceae bacterium]|nr:SAM-dependent chlorinase/fluorinase [Gemmataceae bacterium]MDW8264315.1 SAM-dependent chlorinase/fluorinase [Gemmataceae bacterium]